jgi:hypothetical protein
MCTPFNDAPGWKEQPTKAQGVATARQKPRLLNPIFSCRCAPHRVRALSAQELFCSCVTRFGAQVGLTA